MSKKSDAPVADTLMGHGAFPETDPLYTGMVGMHGTKTADYGVDECDLLIVAGAQVQRPRDRECERNLRKTQRSCSLTWTAAEMNKNVLITEGVIGI